MNIIQFVVMMFELSFLGIFVAFNPLLLISELVIILRSKRPLVNSVVFVAGISVPLLLIAAIGAAVFDENTNIHVLHNNVQLSPIVNLSIGIIFILVAIRQFVLPAPVAQKPKPEEKQMHDKTASMSYVSLFAFAFFRSALSITSIIGILAATKIIKEYTDNYLIIFLGVFWTICIGMSPFVGLLGASIKRPDTIKVLEQRVNPLLNKNYRKSIKWILLVIGLYFVSRAILQILQH